MALLFKLLSLGALVALSRASDGDFLGTLETVSHGVNGELYAEDDQTIVIKSFVYDGESDDAFFVLSKTEKIGDALEFLADELGFKEALGTYMNEDIRLRLRPELKVADFKSMAVFSPKTKEVFGQVVFGKNPKPIVRSLIPVTKFSGKVLHGVSGDVLAIDDSTLLLKNFNYDGLSEDGQFVLYKDANRINETMELLADEEGTTNPMVQYRDLDIVLSLKAGTKLSQYRGVAIYCAKYNVVFGTAEFPTKMPRLPRSARRTTKAVTLGQFEAGKPHNVSGFVHKINEKTLLITRLTYDGMSPDGQFVLTKDSKLIKDPIVLGDERMNLGPLRKYESRDVFVNLPEGQNVNDFHGFALYCAKYNLDFGHVFFSDVEKPALPLVSAKVNMVGAQRLGSLTTILHNVSGEVYALDDQTLFFKNFKYDGESPDGRVVLSKTDKIVEPFEFLNDEWDSADGMLEYKGKDFTLRLKNGKLSDYKALSIFCNDYKLEFGTVVFGVEAKDLPKSKDHVVDAGAQW
jgi:hypothetical protein